jgi:hypothetical protein
MIAWSIARQGREHLPPRERVYRDEAAARRAWARLDVRQGWAELREGERVVERQSGPWAVRTRW